MECGALMSSHSEDEEVVVNRAGRPKRRASGRVKDFRQFSETGETCEWSSVRSEEGSNSARENLSTCAGVEVGTIPDTYSSGDGELNISSQGDSDQESRTAGTGAGNNTGRGQSEIAPKCTAGSPSDSVVQQVVNQHISSIVANRPEISKNQDKMADNNKMADSVVVEGGADGDPTKSKIMGKPPTGRSTGTGGDSLTVPPPLSSNDSAFDLEVAQTGDDNTVAPPTMADQLKALKEKQVSLATKLRYLHDRQKVVDQDYARKLAEAELKFKTLREQFQDDQLQQEELVQNEIHRIQRESKEHEDNLRVKKAEMEAQLQKQLHDLQHKVEIEKLKREQERRQHKLERQLSSQSAPEGARVAGTNR